MDNLFISTHFSQTSRPKLLKFFTLEIEPLKLSHDSRIIKFGHEIRELSLIQFDPAAVIMRLSLGEFNALEIHTPREQVYGYLV